MGGTITVPPKLAAVVKASNAAAARVARKANTLSFNDVGFF